MLIYGLARARDVTGLVDQVQVVAFGAFGVLVGVVMVLPAVARPAVARHRRAACGGSDPPGSLARANAMRNPRRTAITASALVIGLALVGLTATFGASARASVGQRHRRGTAGRLRGEGRRLRRLLHGRRPPASAGARRGSGRCPCGSPTASVDGDVETVGSLDPDALTHVVELGFVSGGPRGLDGNGVLVATTWRAIWA